MLTSVVLILAGITAWCVASLALALIVGPMVRRRDRNGAASAPAAPHAAVRRPAFERRPATGAIVLPLAR